MTGNTRVALTTLGCKVNQSETQGMSEQFAAMGFCIVGFDDEADIYVINTCSVTAMSESKSRQLISRAHRRNPDALIAVTGCYAQRAADEVLALPGVRLVVGSAGKNGLAKAAAELLACGGTRNLAGDIRHQHCYEELSMSSFEGHSRAYIKIEDGCTSFCSYCIIPYLRGPVRSRSMANITAEALRLAKAGYKEVVLGGIHLTSYGRDLPNGECLAGVLEMLEGIDGIERVRLGSLEPAAVDQAFVERVSKCKKLCPHFHLSLQSGSNTVLKRMNRRYTAEQYRQVCQRLRSAFADCAISTDIIVGFPGETEQEFEETCAFAKEIAFSSVHVFAYSRRQGTVAADMPGQISKTVKQQRAHTLSAITKALAAQYAAGFIGKRPEVLVLKQESENLCRGITRQHTEVLFTGNLPQGSIAYVTVTGANGETLNAVL